MSFRAQEMYKKVVRRVGGEGKLPAELMDSVKNMLPNSKVVMGRAKRGIFAGRHIQFGNKVSEDGGNKCNLERGQRSPRMGDTEESEATLDICNGDGDGRASVVERQSPRLPSAITPGQGRTLVVRAAVVIGERAVVKAARDEEAYGQRVWRHTVVRHRLMKKAAVDPFGGAHGGSVVRRDEGGGGTAVCMV
ncbi:uncharacterized protein LOC133891282 isoform X2 [Phragmites australis]|uniref:uncharacterized protein LOC133891282 isoform X2 n=1 Tax=Phragmites australis TaxID=29695 RepID=UPI002D775825|nr:uncharacterized protein LOC133891282 isoform X2 [Phragmites australis]